MTDSSEQSINVYGRLDISVNEAVYEAGKVSTVTILLRNPFDKPVEIIEIQGPRLSQINEASSSRRQLSDQINLNTRRRARSNWFRKFFLEMGRIAITQISFGGVRAEFPRSQKSLNIKAEQNSETTIDNDLSGYDSVNILVEEGATVKFSPQIHNEESIKEENSIVIEPHCETIAYFQMCSDEWLFFTPARRSLSTLVKYRLDGKERTQVIKSEFDIRPPLLSVLIGSIAGSILGTLAKILGEAPIIAWQPTIVSLGGSIVMSLIAAIALSRKTGTQGFITVEDFFGGFVIGALIGYGGSSYFEQALLPSSQENTTP